jgi:hypothetical protein
MFSHVIVNPNNLVINNDCFVIPFGHRCTSALACKYSNMRKFSLPFDWTIPLFPKKIQKVLENNFEDFIPDVYNGVFHNKYDFILAHFNNDINNGVEEYNRRIDRFNYVMNEPKKKYFIYINEDYLYNKNYREDEFNNNMFQEMLELEAFIKKKYVNIDYTILFFNFKNHDIPRDSNIINIVLHSNKLYDEPNIPVYDKLRYYCGKILSHLFETTLTLSIDPDRVFHD